jgi:hypothetical protein
VTGLLTGHYPLKGHLFKMGLMNSPICKRCLETDESDTHIVCNCEVIAYFKFRHLGLYFTQPGDYQDTLVSKILHFIQSVGLLKGWNRGGCTIVYRRSWCKGQFRPTPYAFIQWDLARRSEWHSRNHRESKQRDDWPSINEQPALCSIPWQGATHHHPHDISCGLAMQCPQLCLPTSEAGHWPKENLLQPPGQLHGLPGGWQSVAVLPKLHER